MKPALNSEQAVPFHWNALQVKSVAHVVAHCVVSMMAIDKPSLCVAMNAFESSLRNPDTGSLKPSSTLVLHSQAVGVVVRVMIACVVVVVVATLVVMVVVVDGRGDVVNGGKARVVVVSRIDDRSVVVVVVVTLDVVVVDVCRRAVVAVVVDVCRRVVRVRVVDGQDGASRRPPYFV